MKNINHKNQGPGVRGRKFIPHPSSLILKRFFLSIAAALCLTAGSAWAAGEQIADYTAYPPFLPRTTSPNILFMIDYSAEMITPAYGACTNLGTSDTLSDCRFTYSFLTYDYTSSNTYAGYFDTDTAGQKYASGAIDTASGGSNNNGFYKSATGAWSANFLNWLSMTQFDIIKKVVVGGDVTPAPEGAATVKKIKSSQYEDRWMRKAMNLPGDTAVGATWNACSTADTPDCVKFPALTYNWIATPASGATTIWSDSGTASTDDAVSAPKPIGFTHPFYFYGNSYSYLCISTNGVIGLTNSSTTCDSALTTFTNPDMPGAAAPNNIIAPYWDDLEVSGVSGGGGFTCSVKIFTVTPSLTGAPYNQQPYDISYMSKSGFKIFVISYENVLHYNDTGKADPLSFQILLYEGSNHIVFQYKDVRTATTFGGGKSATIGVENSDGTIAKKFSYCTACATNVLTANGTTGDAVFASPVLTYGIRTTSSGTKAPSFFPAYPLGLALSGGTCPATGPCNPGTSVGAGPYDINIEIKSSATPAAGYYYNSDKATYFDHKTRGLIQDFRDSEASGGIGFRIAVMKVAGGEGGTVTKHFNDTGGWTNTLVALRDQGPSTGSPLSEALYEAQGYFREDTLYRLAVGDWSNLGAGTCPTTGTNYDPYCFKSAGQLVSCCKSFVLAVSAGNYTYDFRTNIYSDILESAGSGPTPAQAGGWQTVPGETATEEGKRTNGGWLDNIAYKSHTTDLRSDIAGAQNLTIYAVNTFGSTGTAGLAQTTLSAGILAADTTIPVASTSGFTPTGEIQIDGETIRYTGKTDATGTPPMSFTGCTRGVAPTTAADHLLGAVVSQQVPAVSGTNVLKRAAKYGGFVDSDGDNAYDADKYNLVGTTCTGVVSGGTFGEDDRNCDGVPDTYFEASGGSNIKTQIENAVSAILKDSASGTSVSVLSTSASGEGAIYQAYFYPARVEGSSESRAWPGYMRSFFIDKYQNMRDDYSGAGTPDLALVMTEDRIAQMCLNATTNEVKVNLYSDSNADGSPDTAPSGACPDATATDMDSVISIWEAGNKLAMRDKGTRNIYTWIDASPYNGSVENGDFSAPAGEALAFVNDIAHRTTLKPYLRAATDAETGNIIDFVRGNAVTGYRNRCITTGSGSETGCTGTQHVWALGDIVYSTPTLVSGPGEKYDQIYGDADYKSFTSKYKQRRSVIYTGANDGMLHAFNGGVYTSGDKSGGKTESGFFEHNSSTTVSPFNGFANGWGSVTIGDELWAFIPQDNLPHLAWLACNGTDTDPVGTPADPICGGSEYTHVYYVDQRPKVTDVRIFNHTASADCSGTATSGLVTGQAGACHPGGWGTILIMGMRLGGGAMDVDLNGDGFTTGAGEQSFRSAYYAFDVTDPEQKPKLLWRFYDASLGFTTSYPAIARICTTKDTPCTGTEKWYMVAGSGPANGTAARDYGSTGNAQPLKVFVVDLSNGSLAQTIQFEGTASTFTMMGDPTVVDADLDFTSDVIYIGANITTSATSTANSASGRVYRINTNSTITAWDKSTLFDPVAGIAASTVDSDPTNGKDMGPLLVSPSVAKDSKGNLWVFFGTGRLRNSTYDLSNSNQQEFYGIKDGCWKGLTETTCSVTATNTNTRTGDKVYQLTDLFDASAVTVNIATGSAQVNANTSTACGVGVTSCAYSTLINTVQAKQGWHTKLYKPTTGSGASERALSRSVVLGGLLLFTAYTPAADLCSIFGDSALYALYYETGTAYIKPALPVEGQTTTIAKSMDLGKGMPTAVGVAIGETVSGFVQKSTGEIVRIEAQPGLGVRSGAASWREKTGGGGTSEIETIYKHIVK